MSGLLTLLGLVGFVGSPEECKPDLSEEKMKASYATQMMPSNGLEARRQKKAQSIIDTIVDAHSTLIKLTDLSPGPITNRVLTNLVEVCSEVHEASLVDEILRNRRLQSIMPSLRSICSEAEACLERHWANHIAQASDPVAVSERLQSFPYYQNYEDMTRLELSAIQASSGCFAMPRNIAFIGSGPLPLTSLCLLKTLKAMSHPGPIPMNSVSNGEAPDDVQILNIDCDETAIQLSSRLSSSLGSGGEGMKYLCVEAGSTDYDLRAFDVVYLAALVGNSQAEKEDILAGVAAKMRPGALIVVRTSWGLRKCLYPEVDLATEKLIPKLQTCMVVHPYENVVNSVVVARVK